ncbi:putative transcription factor MYB/SANT family [Dioscorea sansibarensis]
MATTSPPLPPPPVQPLASASASASAPDQAPAPAPAPAQSPSTPNLQHPPSSQHAPSLATVKSEISPAEQPPAVICRSLEPLAAPPSISIPSCSGWFSWDKIQETERKVLPEFFDGKSATRNPRVYKYYRDTIITLFRLNPSRKITFTEARRVLVGDVGSVRRVFDFLELWGLINYAPSSKQVVKERRGEEESQEKKENPKRICTTCKSICSLACFATDKYTDLILCARCFVRGNYRPGLSSTDFKRVDISEEIRTEWTDKETLHLLEAILHYGEDWKKVAEHVGSRTERECIARFIKLPFGDQFLGPCDFPGDDDHYQGRDKNGIGHGDDIGEQGLSKRIRLSPLADASNPIMAQVAFLSAMVGPEVAKAAAQAATGALHKMNYATGGNESIMGIGCEENEIDERELLAKSDRLEPEDLKEVVNEACVQLNKEQEDVEKSISDIVDVQMKEIQEKIVHFEALELLLEKEQLQLRRMKDLLFADQLNLLRHKTKTNSQKSFHHEHNKARDDAI